MKKFLYILGFIVVYLVAMKWVIPAINQMLYKQVIEEQSVYSDVAPPDYLVLFDSLHRQEARLLYTLSMGTDYPVSGFVYLEEYEVIIMKKDFSPLADKMNFLSIQQPLKSAVINTTNRDLFEGFVKMYISSINVKKPIQHLLVTLPNEGKVNEQRSPSGLSTYLINNSKEFNLFFAEQKNADVEFELSAQLFGRKPTTMGMCIKQLNDVVYLVFIMPKNKAARPITHEFIQKILN